jgi:heme/copper-type cytochrome/quinol oxidase subunit 3
MQYLSGVPDHRTSTGLNNRKLLMLAFLGSDVLFFGTLIAAFLINRGKGIGPHEEIFNIPVTSISTFVLLMSSVAMVLALAAIQHNDLKGLRIWLGVTALLGAVFIGFQVFEFREFALEGLTPRTNIFGTTFLTMTGFHGAHVTIGVVWLVSLIIASYKGHVTQARSLDIEIMGLYWHFVDIVWIVIFGVVYLVGAFGAEEHVASAISASG